MALTNLFTKYFHESIKHLNKPRAHNYESVKLVRFDCTTREKAAGARRLLQRVASRVKVSTNRDLKGSNDSKTRRRMMTLKLSKTCVLRKAVCLFTCREAHAAVMFVSRAHCLVRALSLAVAVTPVVCRFNFSTSLQICETDPNTYKCL